MAAMRRSVARAGMASRCWGAVLVAAAAMTSAPRARAEAAPSDWRSNEYYVLHGAVSAALIGGRILLGVARSEVEAGGDAVWFPGDAGLRGICSPDAAHLSDISMSLAVAVPVGAQLGGGLNAHFVNAEVVYTQALFVSRMLNGIAKVVFRRPRPFSYRKDRECDFVVEESDANMSFYSGHSSNSFAAALAGSYLLSESGLDTRTRSAIWGIEMALAGATANLRARAGKHYYSDIVVGAAVGAGIGLALPVLHGGDYTPQGTDMLAGAIGLVVGVAGSQLVSIGAEAIDEGALTSLTLTPLPLVSAYGLQAIGSW